jgi:hypothetical protein
MSGRSTQTPRLGLNKPDPGGDVDVWGDELNHNADVLDQALLVAQAAASFLSLGGGQLTGPLGLAGAPTAPQHAASKAYVDTAPPAGGPYLPLAGGALTGPLTLAGAPTAPTHAASKAYVDAVPPAGGPYLPLAGGALTGPLTLAGAPTQPQHAASKAYVDEGGPYLPLAGGALTGPLTLAGAPTQPNHAVTKTYVDSMPLPGGPFLPLAGGQLTGALLLAADPATGLGAATKQYVDAHVPSGGPFLPLSGGQMTGPIRVTQATNPLVISANAAAIPITGLAGSTMLQLFGADATNAGLTIDTYGGAATIVGRRAEGTGTAPTFPSGPILTFQVRGWNGANFGNQPKGQYIIGVANPWSATDNSTFHAWSTTAIGTLPMTEKLRLTDAGALQFATTGPSISVGAGAPLASAPVASLFLRTDGPPGSQIYLNSDGAAGWLPVHAGTGPIRVTAGTNPLIITANVANITSGFSTATGLQIIGVDSASGGLGIDSFGFGSVITGRSASGTGAAPGAIPAGQSILNIQARAHNGTTFPGAACANINMAALNAHTGTDRATYITIGTTAAGTTNLVERLRITDQGALQFATTGPSISVGAGAPAITAPAGSIFMRTDGAAGTRIYVSQGATWTPIAGV